MNIVLYLQGGMIKFSVDYLRILLMLLLLLLLLFHQNCYISFAGWHDQVHRGLLAHRPEQERQEKSLRGDQQQAL